ncbi:hypothetical protein [Methylosinus sporium]|uniref:hypothetical protein n=1 Tax=Methylosinus sporium TaxID=428 RepID=UPI0011B1F595|nr:hypothetical protein [Methylosinus sporium]
MSIELRDKFIGYVDILGFSSLTYAVEEGRHFTWDQFAELIKALGTEFDKKAIHDYGPTVCPTAPRIQNNLDFQLTQAWDSVVISTETSPAGAISLVSHCFKACARLLRHGVMCRGYIARGKIFHLDNVVLGSAHVNAVMKEKHVSFYQQEGQEDGTPFIEVSPDIVDFIDTQSDECVKEMFSRMTLTHDGLCAIFPFKRFNAEGTTSDLNKLKANNIAIRKEIHILQQRVQKLVETSAAKDIGRSLCYLRALEEQLQSCDELDQDISDLQQPFGHRMTGRAFPGLFQD